MLTPALLAAAAVLAQCSPDWSLVATAGPGTDTGRALVYDSARSVSVLVGGTNPGFEVWEWNGSTWTFRSTPLSPPNRAALAAAYDSARSRTVIFGGVSSGGPVRGDTWEWDGAAGLWSPRSSTGPAPRTGAGMAFDVSRARCVLFGGRDANYSALSDTWEWDGAAWINRPVPGPPGGIGSALVYDPVRHLIVLPAGDFYAPGAVWEFNGAAWNSRILPGGPSIPPSSAAYDTARARVVAVLRGSYDPGNTTWEIDLAGAGQWVQRSSSGPTGVSGTALTYDTLRSRAVYFEGGTSGGTWEWNGARAASPSIVVQPTGAFINVGDNYTLAVTPAGPGPFTYQWYSGPRYTGGVYPIPGATSRELAILNAGISDSLRYAVQVADACGATRTPSVTVDVYCIADCDGTGFLNIEDFVCYQSAFAAGSSAANCDGSTVAPILNINDFVCFMSRFVTACR